MQQNGPGPTIATPTASADEGPLGAPGARAITRTINRLPLGLPGDYSPYFGCEFDPDVQDFCRNARINRVDSNLKSQQQQQQQQHKQQAAEQKVAKQQSSPVKTATDKIKSKLKPHLLLQPSNLKSQQQQQQKQQQQQQLKDSGPDPSGPAVCAPFDRLARACKVVVSGDVAVGKTSLVSRFGQGAYSSAYRTTIGVDFDLQQYNVLGQPYVLQIWDTAGLERFRCITNAYYRGCQVALLVFDMSNMSTLANVFKWRDEVLAASKTYEQLARELDAPERPASRKQPSDLHRLDESAGPLLFLVGTKCDLAIGESSRAFVTEQANKIAAHLQAELWLVSARTGENVEQLFNRIAALSFNRCILNEIRRAKFEASTLGACLKEKILQQQRDLWSQSSKLIKITKRKEGDERRSRCINIQCVIK